jgi:hypothetical protein
MTWPWLPFIAQHCTMSHVLNDCTAAREITCPFPTLLCLMVAGMAEGGCVIFFLTEIEAKYQNQTHSGVRGTGHVLSQLKR